MTDSSSNALPAALSGVGLKLCRAEHHLKTIKDKVAEFDHGPDVIPGEYEPQTDTHIFRARHDSPPATALSASIGEFLYNVRCALDYIVYELITAAGNPVDFSKSFPIYTKPADYTAYALNKIRGVPDETVASFERLQPFYGPNSDPFHPGWRDPERDPLAVLHRLNNRDKHKTLTLTESVGTIEPQFPDGGEVLARPARVRPGPFKRGAVLAAFAPGSLDAKVKVNLAVTFHVGIHEDRPLGTEDVVQSLDQILRVVWGKVVPEFAPCFGASG